MADISPQMQKVLFVYNTNKEYVQSQIVRLGDEYVKAYSEEVRPSEWLYFEGAMLPFITSPVGGMEYANYVMGNGNADDEMDVIDYLWITTLVEKNEEVYRPIINLFHEGLRGKW